MPQSSTPSDAKEVLCTLRFGWALAELRGRYQPLTGGQWRVQPSTITRTGHALPLSEERSPLEQSIQVEGVVKALAQQLHLDCPMSDLSYPYPHTRQKASEVLTELCKSCSSDSQGWEKLSDPQRWEKLSEFIWAWDAKIQDKLAQGAVSPADAYQLGRGLAEVYWALDPAVTTENDASSWTVLLGPARRTALGHRLNRLSRYFDPVVVPAMRASLDSWGDLAADPKWRVQTDAVPQLYEQIRVWRDLMLGESHPESLLKTRTILARTRTIVPILQAFTFELAMLGAGILLAVAAIVILSSTNNHFVGSLLAAVGFFGITTAGLLARAKNMAQSLLARLQFTLSAELLALQITTCPARDQVQKQTHRP